MAMKQREVFARRVPLYRKNPCKFFAEVTGFAPDPWQKEAATAIAQHRKVSIRSGQGVGKTAFEANLVLWFLSCFPYPRVVCTAPTRQQLNDVLWAEIAKWQERSPVLQAMLVWTKTRVYMKGHEKRWFAVARTATKPENMQGFHEDNMLFVVDEASGVADPIMEAIQGTLSGDNNRLLMCGNPTQNTGTFHDSHTVDAQSYYCIKVGQFRVCHSSTSCPLVILGAIVLGAILVQDVVIAIEAKLWFDFTGNNFFHLFSFPAIISDCAHQRCRPHTAQELPHQRGQDWSGRASSRHPCLQVSASVVCPRRCIYGW